MNTIFRPTENSVAAKSDAAALLALSKRDNPQMARVSTAQHLLFPATPRAICSELGLNWWAAIKLYEDGWLSFCPEDTARLDEAQEAELRFIGSLVISGCDRPMLTSLLSGLSKPYAYHGKRLFYEQAEMGIEAAYEHAADVQAGDMMKPDAAEGIDAFIQKRPPRWQGR